MLKFYDVDSSYIEYLKTIDDKIPNLAEGHQKFVCGVLFDVHGQHYFAPVSSFAKQRSSTFVMYDNRFEKEMILGTLRFSFMFPLPEGVYWPKDFSKETDEKYKRLLQSQYVCLKKNEEKVRRQAMYVYRNACNPEHELHEYCCDFLKLEKTATMQGYKAFLSERTFDKIIDIKLGKAPAESAEKLVFYNAGGERAFTVLHYEPKNDVAVLMRDDKQIFYGTNFPPKTDFDTYLKDGTIDDVGKAEHGIKIAQNRLNKLHVKQNNSQNGGIME